MYETIVEYKELIMMGGAILFILLAFLALLSAYMFQGSTQRRLSGHLYSTYIAIGIVSLLVAVAEYLIYISGKINMAIGLAMLIFSFMIMFTVSVLCFAAKSHKPGTTLKLGMFT